MNETIKADFHRNSVTFSLYDVSTHKISGGYVMSACEAVSPDFADLVFLETSEMQKEDPGYHNFNQDFDYTAARNKIYKKYRKRVESIFTDASEGYQWKLFTDAYMDSYRIHPEGSRIDPMMDIYDYIDKNMLVGKDIDTIPSREFVIQVELRKKLRIE